MHPVGHCSFHTSVFAAASMLAYHWFCWGTVIEFPVSPVWPQGSSGLALAEVGAASALFASDDQLLRCVLRPRGTLAPIGIYLRDPENAVAFGLGCSSRTCPKYT